MKNQQKNTGMTDSLFNVFKDISPIGTRGFTEKSFLRAMQPIPSMPIEIIRKMIRIKNNDTRTS